MRDDLIGLRDEDLTPEERATRDAHLAADPDAAADEAFAARLTADLPVSEQGGPPLSALAANRPSRRRWIAPAAGALAMAAALALVVLNTGPEVRDRGVGGTAPVALAAVADGPHGTRRLADGDHVAPDERVVFWVDSASAGDVTLYENGRPVVRGWSVEPGAQALGGETPQSWRPDAGNGPMTYRAERCGPPCTEATLRLVWD